MASWISQAWQLLIDSVPHPDKLLDVSDANSPADEAFSGYLTGYWGNVDSSVDWCEPNYVMTTYVAEFFNTMSSLPIAIWALLGMIYTYRFASREWRFYFAFAGIMGVGLGSAAFHGTLRFHAQLLDELPMLLGSMASLYCCIETRQPKHERSNKLLIFVLFTISLIVVVSYVIFKYWFIFLFVYIATIITQTVFTCWYVRDLSRNLFIASVLIYHTGVIFWVTDLLACRHVQPYQFHSVWHLAAGYGTYLWVITLIVMRGQYLKKEHRLHMSGFLTHYVKLKVNTD